MFRIEATPNVQLITAWISHHLSLKIQVPVYRLITQKGMCSVNNNNNTYIALIRMRSKRFTSIVLQYDLEM